MKKVNPTLAAQNLSFGYEQDTPILSDWSAEFYPGEVVAITGPSGRGKSTLLYLLGLMLKPDRGEILVDGVAAQSLPDHLRSHYRAERFGFVFQDAALDTTRSVLDNILESSLYRNSDRKDAAKMATKLMTRFGVQLRADAKPGQVSGGQAQRIALCRALLGKPDILLADEPTGNLDPASTDTVVDAFHQHASEGACVVVVTHDPHLVQRCNRNVAL